MAKGALTAVPSRALKSGGAVSLETIRLRALAVVSSPEQLVVFTGPSLSHAEAATLAKAEICPPVRSGDLDRLGDNKAVAIIDGVLEPGLVLSIGEVRRALQRGVKIWGAASLGALRAFQTHSDGMEGSRWVYL